MAAASGPTAPVLLPVAGLVHPLCRRRRTGDMVGELTGLLRAPPCARCRLSPAQTDCRLWTGPAARIPAAPATHGKMPQGRPCPFWRITPPMAGMRRPLHIVINFLGVRILTPFGRRHFSAAALV